jgi:hypothetical protein
MLNKYSSDNAAGLKNKRILLFSEETGKKGRFIPPY